MEETFQSKCEKLIPKNKSEFGLFNSKGCVIPSGEDTKPQSSREKFNYIPGLNEPGINCGE